MAVYVELKKRPVGDNTGLVILVAVVKDSKTGDAPPKEREVMFVRGDTVFERALLKNGVAVSRAVDDKHFFYARSLPSCIKSRTIPKPQKIGAGGKRDSQSGAEKQHATRQREEEQKATLNPLNIEVRYLSSGKILLVFTARQKNNSTERGVIKVTDPTLKQGYRRVNLKDGRAQLSFSPFENGAYRHFCRWWLEDTNVHGELMLYCIKNAA